jgi:copper resistance protein C
MGTQVGAALACALTLLLAVLGPAPAMAHTDLLGSSPADGASLDALPDRVQLEFAQRVLPELSEVELRGPDGTRSAEGLLVAGDALVAIVDPDGPDGAWAVGYRVVAADGHVVTGSVDFSVGDGVTAARSDAGLATPWVIGGLVLGVVLVALRLLRPSRQRSPQSAP